MNTDNIESINFNNSSTGNKRGLLPIGFILTLNGRIYTIIDILSDRGVSALVYKAKDQNNKIVSIKELFPYFKQAQNPTRSNDNRINWNGTKARVYPGNISEEINILSDLKGNVSGVVKYISHGDENNTTYLVTKLVKGLSFFKWIEDNLPDEDAENNIFLNKLIRIAINILHVLVEIKNKGIIHRDIKPEHILIDDDLKITLIDFGAAIDTNINEPETSIGSPGYIAPEVRMDGKESTYAADLYSLGEVFENVFDKTDQKIKGLKYDKLKKIFSILLGKKDQRTTAEDVLYKLKELELKETENKVNININRNIIILTLSVLFFLGIILMIPNQLIDDLHKSEVSINNKPLKNVNENLDKKKQEELDRKKQKVPVKKRQEEQGKNKKEEVKMVSIPCVKSLKHECIDENGQTWKYLGYGKFGFGYVKGISDVNNDTKKWRYASRDELKNIEELAILKGIQEKYPYWTNERDEKQIPFVLCLKKNRQCLNKGRDYFPLASGESAALLLILNK